MWQTIGHEWAVQLLSRAVASRRVAHTYLFTGPSGAGKTHLAQQLAAALNCQADNDVPCGVCSACARVAHGTHPDVSLVEPLDDRIKIEQIRALQHELSISPYEGHWRVAIVTEFHTATVEAANALLKTLEEPPSRVLIVLTATDASQLLPTIVSRCQVLPLRSVPWPQIQSALEERWNVDEDRANALAREAGGCPGWAVRAVQDPGLAARRQEEIDQVFALLEQGQASRIKTIEGLSKREEPVKFLLSWQAWFRDVALVAAGCEDLATHLDQAELLRRQAAHLGLARARSILHDIESTMQQLEQNVNARLALEVLVLRWPQPEQS
ncbi:MAG: DNA polymerase III subunit delta' [Anaerolineae bacterium]